MKAFVFHPSFVRYRWWGIAVCLFLSAVSFEAGAQTLANANSENKHAFDKIIGIENAGIINGVEYKMQRRGASTHPFFLTGEVTGKVIFDNQWYNASVLYDIFKDALIIKHLSSGGRGWFIELEKARVQAFIIDNRLFRNLDRGYHEVIYDSANFQVVVRRSKATQVSNRVLNYVSTDEYFIVDNGRWKPLRRVNGLADVLNDKNDRKAAKKYLNDSRLRLKKSGTRELAKAANFVNVLRLKTGT